MGEAKRRKLQGATIRRATREAPPGGMSFEAAMALTQSEGVCCWTWMPRRRGGMITGAETFVSYLDDDGDEEFAGVWITIEGDEWDTPWIGEQDNARPSDIDDSVKEATWYRSPVTDRFSLPDFSFLKLRALGCTDPQVLTTATAFDAAEAESRRRRLLGI